MHWEIWASAGFGATFTEVIARDPAEQFKAFKNTALTPNFGIGSRFFLTDWLTVNFAHPRLHHHRQVRAARRHLRGRRGRARRPRTTQLVNNFIAYIGVGMYLPTKFTYKTPR